MQTLKKVLPVFILLLVGLGLGIGFFVLTTRIKPSSALDIDSYPKAKVFINAKESGMTPFYKEGMSSGEYTVRLDTADSVENPSYEIKVRLIPGVVTMVEHFFGKSEDFSSSRTVYLDKSAVTSIASISIVTIPDSVLVKIDGEEKGVTPLSLKDVPIGNHDIVLSKPGFADQSVKGIFAKGYDLNIFSKLAKFVDTIVVQASPSAVPVQPVQSSPVATPTVTPSATALGQIEISQTPTGYLRVRSTPGNGGEIGKVMPGEKYDIVTESGGWYEIKTASGVGWVSGQYAKKI